MRQPEVARLAALVLAAILVAPVAHGGWSLLVAGAFLVEFLSDGGLRPLSSLAAAPSRRPLAVEGARVDRYVPAGPGRGAPLVLVHGYAPAGKDDPRVRQAAALLARAGFDVAVPTIPGLTRGRLRPDDAAPVIATLADRPGPTVLAAVSVGAGPALLAAADPRVRDRVATVVSVGGYASAAELLRFFLTGEYAFGDRRGHVAHDPALVRQFVDANADLVDAATRRALASGDREQVTAALAALPPEVRGLLGRLSPERVVGDLRARLILVHGRDDPAIPYTESLRLAAARPARTTVVLVGVLEHVEGAPAPPAWAAVRDFLALWGVVYALMGG